MKWMLATAFVLLTGCSEPSERPKDVRGLLKMEPSEVSEVVRPGMTRADVMHHLGLPMRRYQPGAVLDIRTNAVGDSRVRYELWQYRIWKESGPLVDVVFSTNGVVERIHVGTKGDPESLQI